MNVLRNKFFRILYISSMWISCNNQNTTTSQTDGATALASPEEVASNTTCYKHVSGKDSVRIQLTGNGNNVTGELVYSFFEKDKNTGTLEGQMKGDTIFADYTFQSEGSTSVREIALLKRGDELVEGYGEVREQAGKMVFVNKSALNFDGKMILQETPCQ